MKPIAKILIRLAIIAVATFVYIQFLAPLLHAQPIFVWLPVYILIILFLYIKNRKNTWAVKGNFYYINGQYEPARLYLKKAIDANCKSYAAYLYYSILILREDGNTKDAFLYLDKAAKHKKNVLEERGMLTTLATCYWIDGRIDKGIKILEDIRKNHSYINETALTTLGYLYLLQQNYTKAIEITQLALDIDPENASAWDNMGQIYFKQNEPNIAKQHFLKAVGYRDGLVDSNYFLGVIFENEGDIETSQTYFKKASICQIDRFNTVTKQQIDDKLAGN